MPGIRRALARIAITVAMLTIAFGIGSFRASAQDATSVVVDLAEQNSSGISGTATLTENGSQTAIHLDLQGSNVGSEPVHIFKGDCTNYNADPAFDLKTLDSNGASDSTVDLSLADLQAGGYQISVHQSATNLGTIVSCGVITTDAASANTTTPTQAAGTTQTATTAAVPQGVTIQLPTSNDSGASGSATLTENGSQTDVLIALNGVAGTNTAAIYPGTCDNLTLNPAFSLTDLDANGASSTTIDTPLQTLLDGDYSLLVSDPNIALGEGSAIACGEIVGTLTGTTSAPSTGAGTTADAPVNGSLVALLGGAGLVFLAGLALLRRGTLR